MRLLLKLGLMAGFALAFFPVENHLLVLAGVVVVLACVLFAGWRHKEFALKELFNPYSSLLGLIFAWSILSFLWVESRQGWLNAVGIIGIAFAFALVMTLLGQDRVWRKHFSWYIMLIIGVHHLMGWYFVFERGLHLALDQVLQFNLTLGNPTWFFRNINDYAFMMFFSLFYALALPIDLFEIRKWQNITVCIKYILVASSLGLVVFAGSRGIAGATVMCLGLYLFLHIKERRIRLTLVGLAVAVGSLLLIVFYDQLYTSLASDSSAVIRLNLVRNGRDYLINSYGLGVGAGNVNHYLAAYPYNWTWDISLMHNWFMGLLTANGILIGGLYVLYYIRSLILSYRLSLKTESLKSKFVFTWLAGFIIAGAIPDSLFPYIWFWLMHHVVFLSLEEENKQALEKMQIT